jgi:hypothetical protein
MALIKIEILVESPTKADDWSETDRLRVQEIVMNFLEDNERVISTTITDAVNKEEG